MKTKPKNEPSETNSETEPESKEQEQQPVNELDTCRQQAQEYLAGWQRAQADYQNLQKETAKRISDSVKYGTEALLMQLLPTVDHFKYAFKGIPADERESSWLKGIEHIQTNLMKVLEEHGIEVIKTVGEVFNPELHEAIEEVEVDGGVSGQIAEEVATGFCLNGKVIQCAKVKVIK